MGAARGEEEGECEEDARPVGYVRRDGAMIAWDACFVYGLLGDRSSARGTSLAVALIRPIRLIRPIGPIGGRRKLPAWVSRCSACECARTKMVRLRFVRLHDAPLASVHELGWSAYCFLELGTNKLLYR